MQLNSVQISEPATPVFVRLWIPAVVGTLALIVFFTVYSVFFVPYVGFDIGWRPDGIATVWKFGLRSSTPAERYLRPNDVLLAIDGEPVRMIDWKPLFPVPNQSYEFLIQRDRDTLTYKVPVAALNAREVLARAISGLVAFATWALGTLVLRFATTQNRDAWRVGFVFLGLALALAAAQADEVNTPFAGIASSLLIPIMVIGFVEIAFLPRRSSRSSIERSVFGVLYAAAILLTTVVLAETLFLLPYRDSVELRTGTSLNGVLMLFLGTGLVANPIIVFVRFLKSSQSYLRQQLLIILVAVSIAVLPLILFSLLPVIALGFEVPVVPYELTVPLLVLIPAAYGFVVYRRQYLNLDIFATNTLALLGIGIILTVLYSAAFYIGTNVPGLATLEPLPTVAFMLLALVLVPRVGKPLRGAAQTLFYGSTESHQGAMEGFMASLSADPQRSTLRRAFIDIAGILQVRKAMLLLTDEQGHLLDIERLRVAGMALPFPAAEIVDLPTTPFVRSGGATNDPEQRLFAAFAWAALIAPLHTRGTIVGLLVFGPRVPDEYYNAHHVAFVRQISDAMAVATDAIRLFEASREISRELLRVRDVERRQLSAQIHDEPLQRISVVVNALDKLIALPEITSARLDSELSIQKDHLRGISRELRGICVGLRPPVLEQGIQWALKKVIADFGSQSEIDVELEIEIPSQEYVLDDVTTAIYYVLMEALNNIGKHSHASAAWVRLGTENGNLRLSVRDNGKGVSLGSMSLSDLVRSHHIGIVGMHEWASLVQGTITISQPSDGGTDVIFEVPIDTKPKGKYIMYEDDDA